MGRAPREARSRRSLSSMGSTMPRGDRPKRTGNQEGSGIGPRREGLVRGERRRTGATSRYGREGLPRSGFVQDPFLQSSRVYRPACQLPVPTVEIDGGLQDPHEACGVSFDGSQEPGAVSAEHFSTGTSSASQACVSRQRQRPLTSFLVTQHFEPAVTTPSMVVGVPWGTHTSYPVYGI